MARGKLNIYEKPEIITKKKRDLKPALNNIRDCQRFLGMLIHEVRQGQTESSEATRQAYITQVLIKTFELTDIEDKISQLEERLTNSSNGHR